MKKYILFLVFLVFLACSKPESNQQLSSSFDEVDIQKIVATERIWKDVITDSLGLDNDVNTYSSNPTHLRGSDQYLYVMDTADNLIKKFSLRGEFLQNIGNGYGRGPGEFLTFSDITLRQDSGWVVDVNKKEISSFDSEGKIESSFYFTPNTYRLATTGQKIFLLSLGDTSLVYEYNLTGELVKSYGKILENQFMRPLDLSGRILYLDNREELLYIPHKASYLIYFDKNGFISRVIQTVDRIPFPNSPAKEIGEGEYRVSAPRSKIEISDWSIVNQKLFLKGFMRTGVGISDREDFIDVYSLDGTRYYYSFKVPFAFHSFHMTENRIYFIEIGYQRVVALTYSLE